MKRKCFCSSMRSLIRSLHTTALINRFVAISIAALISLAVQQAAFHRPAYACSAAQVATANPIMKKGRIFSGDFANTTKPDCRCMKFRESNGKQLDAQWEYWRPFTEASRTKVMGIRIYFRANASATDDFWYIRFYDYSMGTYSSTWYQLGTSGFGPCFRTYAINILDAATVQKYLNDSGNFKINLCDGKASGLKPIDRICTHLSIDYFAIEFIYDNTSPAISNVVATHNANGTVTLSWNTNEPSTSQVEYGLDTGYSSTTSEDTNLVTSHSVMLSALLAGATYHLRVRSRDACQNLAVSNDYTFKTTQWVYATSATALAPPSLHPGLGIAFVGGNDTDVHAITTTNGTQGWAPYSTGGTIKSRSPVAQIKINGIDTYVIYAASSDGYLYALNAATGAILNENWPKQVTTASLQGSVCGLNNLNIPGIDVSNTDKWVLFVGTYDTSTTSANKIVALDAVTGDVLWTYQGGGSNPNMDIIAASPARDSRNSTVYFTSYANGGPAQPSLWALDAVNGNLKWSKSLNNISSSPTICRPTGGSNVFVGTDQGYLYKFDPDGKQIWVFTATGAGAVRGFPWVQEGDKMNQIYFCTTLGRVYSVVDTVVDNGAAVLPNANWDGGKGYVSVQSPTAPLVVPSLNKLYVGSGDGNIYELNLSDGAVITKQYIGYATSDLTLDTAKGLLLVGAANGKIYCFPVPF